MSQPNKSSLGVCIYCNTQANNRKETVICARCGRPHHEDCWRENGGCSLHGCGSRSYDKLYQHINFDVDEHKRNKQKTHLDLRDTNTTSKTNQQRHQRRRATPPPPQHSPPSVDNRFNYNRGMDSTGAKKNFLDDPCKDICECILMAYLFGSCIGAPAICADGC